MAIKINYIICEMKLSSDLNRVGMFVFSNKTNISGPLQIPWSRLTEIDVINQMYIKPKNSIHNVPDAFTVYDVKTVIFLLNTSFDLTTSIAFENLRCLIVAVTH